MQYSSDIAGNGALVSKNNRKLQPFSTIQRIYRTHTRGTRPISRSSSSCWEFYEFYVFSCPTHFNIIPLLLLLPTFPSSADRLRIEALSHGLPARVANARHRPLLRHDHPVEHHGPGGQDCDARVQGEKSRKSNGECKQLLQCVLNVFPTKWMQYLYGHVCTVYLYLKGWAGILNQLHSMVKAIIDFKLPVLWNCCNCL